MIMLEAVDMSYKTCEHEDKHQTYKSISSKKTRNCFPLISVIQSVQPQFIIEFKRVSKGFAKTTFGQKDEIIISTKDQMLFL